MNARPLIPSILAAAALAALAPAAGPQETKVSPPPAIEVRVHVSAGGAFQEDLKLEEFTLLEDGWPQSIRSLALVRGGNVTRREGDEAAAPALERHYILLFQAVDWDPKLAQVIDYLFGSILKPGDAMMLITPFKPYQLQKDALAVKSKAALSAGMEEVLRKDILRGSGEYRELIGAHLRSGRGFSPRRLPVDRG